MMKDKKTSLIFNPGSTSTKISLYDGLKEVAVSEFTVSADELNKYVKLIDQVSMRADQIRAFMSEHDIKESDIDILIPRYPHFKSKVPGHVMANEDLIADCRAQDPEPFHIMQYSPLMLYEVFKDRIPMAIVDMFQYVEQPECLKTTGLPGVIRPDSCHIENTISITAQVAEQEGKTVEEIDLIVAHLGGGVSFNWVSEGKIRYRIFNGEGAFSPERAGAVPAMDLIRMCFSGNYTEKEMTAFIRNKGGLVAHLGTNNCRMVEQAIKDGDEKAKTVYDAMIMSMIASIGQVLAVAGGKAEKLVLTGGIANSEYVRNMIHSHLEKYIPVIDMPGEHESEFFALFGKNVLDKDLEINDYESPYRK